MARDDDDALELALVKQIGRESPEMRAMRERLHGRETGTALSIAGRGRANRDRAGLAGRRKASRKAPRGV